MNGGKNLEASGIFDKENLDPSILARCPNLKYLWGRSWYQHMASTGDGFLPARLQELVNPLSYHKLSLTAANQKLQLTMFIKF